MKKITLALVAAFSSFNMVHSQVNVTIEAPVHNANYIDLLPSGASSEASLTAIYLYNATDLSALTGTNLTTISIQLNRGVTGTAVSGTFTLYLKNTTDATYNAGTSFSTAIQSMTVGYTGNLTIPNNAPNGTAIPLVIPPNTFTYTGAGLYVGFKFNSAGPFVTAGTNNANLAAYPSNTLTSAADMGAFSQAASTATTISDAMQTLNARPCLLFKAVNTATNEVGVNYIIAPGKVAKSLNSPQIVQALVKNNSTGPISNISVSLAVSGANTFANVQTIANLASDATATVSFASFNPQVQGTNNMSVTINSDQNNANNRFVWTQSVTCNVMANNPPEPIASFDGAVGWNAANSGIFATVYTPGANTTLTAVRIAIGSDADVVNTYLYAVLLDDQGTIIANGDSIKMTSSLINNFVNFKFAASQPLQANTSYIIGLAQPQGGNFPMAYKEAVGYEIPDGSYLALNDLNGGNFNISSWGYFGIEPVLGPDANILAPSSSSICINESFELNSNEGATTYSWSAVPGSTVNGITTPTLANITVVPTKTGNIVYTLKATDAAGCSNTSTISARVYLCTGISTNLLNDANVKLYPNPTVNGKSTISGLEGKNTITVYNILGQSVITKITNDETATIDLSTQPTGNYMVRIVDSNNHTKTIKVLNQN